MTECGKDAVTGAVDDVLSDVRDFFAFSDAKRGPLSDLTASGEAIMTTLAEGVRRRGADTAQRA